MQTLAVVPIFMSAGAAVMPTVVGAVVSIVAVILKPRELVRLMRRRPLAGLTGVLVTALVVMGLWWIFSGRAAKAMTLGSTPKPKVDWAKVAEDILARQSLGQGHGSTTELATSAPGTMPAGDAAVVEGHDFARTSYAGGKSPINLKQLWSFRPEGVLFLAAPAIAGNRVYVAGCVQDLGGYTGMLACLDKETGKKIWDITEADGDPMKPFFSSPAITADGKRLIIGQGLHQDKNCQLMCFDTADGKLKWAVQTTLHIESSPAILGDIAVVGAGAIEGTDKRPTGDPGHVIAVRISDGKELWRQPVADAESSPAMDDTGTVYIGSGFNGNAVVALKSAADITGDRIAWKTPVDYPVTSAIALLDDLVIAGAGNGDVVSSARDPRGLVVALDKKTGNIKWKTQFDDSVLGGVASRGDTLICPVRTGEVIALSAKDGSILWKARISGKAAVLASCAFTGDKVYAVSTDGYLAILDAKDGRIIEKQFLNDAGNPGSGLSMSPPQVADGRVYVGSETGGIKCFVGTE